MLSSSTTVPPTTMKSQRKRRQHVSVEMCVYMSVLGLHLCQIKTLGCIDRINCQKHEIEFLFLDSCMDCAESKTGTLVSTTLLYFDVLCISNKKNGKKL